MVDQFSQNCKIQNAQNVHDILEQTFGKSRLICINYFSKYFFVTDQPFSLKDIAGLLQLGLRTPSTVLELNIKVQQSFNTKIMMKKMFCQNKISHMPLMFAGVEWSSRHGED